MSNLVGHTEDWFSCVAAHLIIVLFALQRKGIPYCHNPCYKALFGPQILGYGSNISSPANFRKSTEIIARDSNSIVADEQDGMKCIFRTKDTSPGSIRFHRKVSSESPQKRHSLGSIYSPKSSSSSESSDSGRSSMVESSSSLESVSERTDKTLKCIYKSEVNGPVSNVTNYTTSHILKTSGDSWKPSKNWNSHASPPR